MAIARALIVTAVTAAATFAATAPAAAECAMPRPALFPWGGTLPPRPTLYLFEPAFGAPAAVHIDGAHGPVGFTATDVSSSDGLRVTMLAVAADAGPLAVTIGGGPPHRFALAPVAPAAPPEVERVTWIDDAWTCSHTTGIAIELTAPGVVAFRVRWTGGAEAIVPPSDRAYFASPDAPPDPIGARALLGHANCMGDQIPVSMIDRRDFTLTAIYADAREREVELRHEPPAPPSTATATAAPAAPPARGRDRRGRLALAGGVAAVALCWLARRRRRRPVVVAP